MAAYRESTKALVEGGVDLILIETVFDTLNAKAAVFAVKEEFEALGVDLPIMISGLYHRRVWPYAFRPDDRSLL